MGREKECYVCVRERECMGGGGEKECVRERVQDTERVLIPYIEYFVFLHSWSWTVTE